MSGPYEIDERIPISVVRTEANFDRACDEAYARALNTFECDDNGHIHNVRGSNRATDSIIVLFDAYTHVGEMSGQTHIYRFIIWVTRAPEE